MVLAHDASSHCTLQLYEVSSKYQEQFSTYRMDTKLHLLMFQWELFEKKYKQESWFLCMTRRLNELYKCMKFHQNILNGFKL